MESRRDGSRRPRNADWSKTSLAPRPGAYVGFLGGWFDARMGLGAGQVGAGQVGAGQVGAGQDDAGQDDAGQDDAGQEGLALWQGIGARVLEVPRGELVVLVRERRKPRAARWRSTPRESDSAESDDPKGSGDPAPDHQPHASSLASQLEPRSEDLADLTDALLELPEYAASFDNVLALCETFQKSLKPEQLDQWLLLEEALLEHFRLLQEAHYWAGRDSVSRVTTSGRGAREGQLDRAGAKELPISDSDTQTIAALAAAIERVVRRGR